VFEQFSFNIVTIFLFVPLVICEGFILYIYSKNPYNFLNKLFIIFLSLFVIWIITEIVNAATTSGELAEWSVRIGILGLNFAGPAFLLFILAFVREERLIKNFWFLVSLFGISMIFLFLSWRSDFIISYEMKLFPWGWQNVPGKYTGFYSMWVAALFISSFFFVARFYLRTRIPDEKKQAFLLFVGILPVFIAGMVSQVIAPVIMHERSFLFDAIVFPFTVFPLAFFLGIAIIKYKLFVISPSLVIPSIIDTMAEALVVFNPSLYIEFVNHTTLEFLGYTSTDELVGRRLDTIIVGGNIWETLLRRGVTPLQTGREVRNLEIKFLTRDGKEVPVNFSASPLKTPAGEFVGAVALAYDMGETKKLIHSLEKKLTELSEAKHNLERTLGKRLL